jgi:hypothetical protein
MAGGERLNTVNGARSWIGTMLVAWTLVSGCAIVIASAYYYRTHDIRFLITWLAPPFLIGCLLFAVMGTVSVAGNVKNAGVEIVNSRGTRQSIFRK